MAACRWPIFDQVLNIYSIRQALTHKITFVTPFKCNTNTASYGYGEMGEAKRMWRELPYEKWLEISGYGIGWFPYIFEWSDPWKECLLVPLVMPVVSLVFPLLIMPEYSVYSIAGAFATALYPVFWYTRAERGPQRWFSWDSDFQFLWTNRSEAPCTFSGPIYGTEY